MLSSNNLSFLYIYLHTYIHTYASGGSESVRRKSSVDTMYGFREQKAADNARLEDSNRRLVQVFRLLIYVLYTCIHHLCVCMYVYVCMIFFLSMYVCMYITVYIIFFLLLSCVRSFNV
jgi:hypothetical protein